jgi:hypothetical protein
MIDILLIIFLGRFLGHRLLQWWIEQQNPSLKPTSETTWPETNDNWHEDPNIYMWHASPTNEWEAASLPHGWGTFTPPITPTGTTPALTPEQQRRAEYRQIENLKP